MYSVCKRLQLSLLLTLVSIPGLAQEEGRYADRGSEHVIINDSLHYRIEFREYPELGEKSGLKKWKYFEFDCAQRLGSVVRKVRITSGWGMRVIDEEMDSARGIKYQYTYISPYRNLEDKSKKYLDKLKVLTNPTELLEIQEIKEILSLNVRHLSRIEYYMNDSLLVSRFEFHGNKLSQVDSARYDHGRLVYTKNEFGSVHHFRYDFDSTGMVRVAYDSGDHDKTVTKYHHGRPLEKIYMTRYGEITGRLRTTYSGDTLTIEAYFDPRGALEGPRRMHLRKWNAQMNAKTYSLNGLERYAVYYDEKGRVIKETWKGGVGEYTRTYRYLSGR